MALAGWELVVTRREAVLHYLQAHANTWVGGMKLMNAEVGGTRAGGRIHELRKEGFVIEARPSKRSAVFDYRLVDERQMSLFGEAA